MIRVSRTAIELFGLSIHWYALLIVSGILLAVALAAIRERRLNLPADTALDIALVCVPAAIVGARIYYVAFEWSSFSGGPWWKVFAVWEGGLAVYGGIIAGVLAGWFYARAKKLPFWRLTDLAAPCIPLGQAIGRWGNFVNQEAHGALVLEKRLQFFPVSVNIGGEWFYATFFYESVWCLAIVAVLLIAERKRWFVREGDAFFAYVLLYALERSVVEGMRTDSLYIGPVRVSQALSLLALLAVTVIWAVRQRKLPAGVRWIAPGCALVAMALAAAGHDGGMLVAAALACAAAFIVYDQNKRMIRNRGEGL